MPENNRTEIEKRIDILEDEIAELDPRILRLLLKDKTTRGNILWCTKDYESYGVGYEETSQMSVELITGEFSSVIQPRASKSKAIRDMRVKKRAEVFTPSWVCNEQNNQVDDTWFGRPNVFNTPCGTGWVTSKGKIEFSEKKKSWKAYVDAKRLEITCGEAPYLVSRYDTTTGDLIPVYERMERFDQTFSIKLIYIFSMPYDTHKGLLKIGEATLTTSKSPDSLTPNCHDLNQAALARIKSYTDTASVSFNLLHTEVAIKSVGSYTWMTRDFLKYVSEQPTTQHLWQVMGSNRYISCYGSFQAKAKASYKTALTAIDDETLCPSAANSEWREIYGSKFPNL